MFAIYARPVIPVVFTGMLQALVVIGTKDIFFPSYIQRIEMCFHGDFLLNFIADDRYAFNVLALRSNAIATVRMFAAFGPAFSGKVCTFLQLLMSPGNDN